MKKTVGMMVVGMAMAFAVPAYADNHAKSDASEKQVTNGWKEMREKFRNMSDEERAAFHKERQERWQKLSKEEKLQMIEDKRARKKAYWEEKEAKWNAMSDEEKIAHVEEKMSNWEERRKKRRGKRCGTGDDKGEE